MASAQDRLATTTAVHHRMPTRTLLGCVGMLLLGVIELFRMVGEFRTRFAWELLRSGRPSMSATISGVSLSAVVAAA